MRWQTTLRRGAIGGTLALAAALVTSLFVDAYSFPWLYYFVFVAIGFIVGAINTLLTASNITSFVSAIFAGCGFFFAFPFIILWYSENIKNGSLFSPPKYTAFDGVIMWSSSLLVTFTVGLLPTIAARIIVALRAKRQIHHEPV